MEAPLAPALVDRVLERLGLSSRPAPEASGLRALYGAWCHRVPFDNLRKRIALSEGHPGVLPGDTPGDFFAGWLAEGAGGTCWAGAGALCALLSALGFRAQRGLATMLVAPDLPPNHGTVVVDVDATRWLLDASILHGEPLALEEASGPRSVSGGAWGAQVALSDGHWHVRWRPLHAPAGIDCRIDEIGVGAERFSQMHEQTRSWSPFNYAVYARRNRADAVVGVAFGRRVELGADGSVATEDLDPTARDRLLIEEFGVSEALVRRLPVDAETPPPPGSRTAQRAAP